MAALHTLTVQDILWINLQVTGQVNTYDFARLEEATYYQYAYGESNSLVPQASRFIKGFLRKSPFAAGNEATALIALVAFLNMNGAHVTLDDSAALGWLSGIADNPLAASEITILGDPHDHEPNPKAVVKAAMVRYATTLKSLAG